MSITAADIDYEQLRRILERELDRPVSIDEATGIGKHLVNVYEILLYNGGECDKIEMDTTNR
ncbi:MAG: hypothetical protein ACREGA_00190 [Candidatus Saccharimonadales bacterium]